MNSEQKRIKELEGLLQLVLDNAKRGGYVAFNDEDIEELQSTLSHQGGNNVDFPEQQPVRMPPRPEVDTETAENLKIEDGYFKGFHEGSLEMWDDIARLNAAPIAQTAPQPEQSGLPREVIEAYRAMDAIPHSTSHFDTPEIARAKDRLVGAVRAALSATSSPTMDAKEE